MKFALLVEVEAEGCSQASADFMAEIVENCIQHGLEAGFGQYNHGNGPNPPYEATVELISVTPETF